MKKSESKSKTSSKKATGAAKPGMLIILSAPSGCGKTTLVDRLLKRHEDWVRSISMTTRKPRLGETHGKDYYFVTAAELKALEGKGELLESAKVFDHIYATPKSFVVKHLQNGNNVLLAIDVQGTKKIRKVLESEYRLCTIFVLPPSIKVLRERLEGRQTEAPEEIQRRIEVAQDEIKEAGLYDFTVVNQNLDQTVQEIEADIEKFDQERRN